MQVLSGSELIFVNDKGLLGKNRVLNLLDGRMYDNPDWSVGFGARVLHATNQLWILKEPNEITVWDIETNKLLYDLQIKGADAGAGKGFWSTPSRYSSLQ